MNKEVKGRFTQRHDTEVNWKKAINFIPMEAEIIIYDPDENYNFARFKVGDGVTLINDLPFSTSFPMTIKATLTTDQWYAEPPNNIVEQWVEIPFLKATTPIVMVDCELTQVDMDANNLILENWGNVSSQTVQQNDGGLWFYAQGIPSINIPIIIGIC